MKRYFFLLIFTSLLHANSETFSVDRLRETGDEFYCQQEDKLHHAGLTEDYCREPRSDVNPFVPPHGLPPSPKDGFLPVVIVNGTGANDDDVYLVMYGKDPQNSEQWGFIEFNDMGIGSFAPITSSKRYTLLLSDLPSSSIEGTGSTLIYVPYVRSGRVYISVGTPLFLKAEGTSISAPAENNFTDPNYEVFYEDFEITFLSSPPPPQNPQAINWTATCNTTSVDTFSGPVEMEYYSYPTGQTLASVSPQTNAGPSGFSGNKTQLFTNYQSTFSTHAGPPGTLPLWNRLFIPFYQNPYDNASPIITYLRVISPNSGFDLVSDPSVPTFYNTHQPFPKTYLSTATPTNYINAFYSAYGGAAPTSNLVIDTELTPSVTYTGQVTGANNLYMQAAPATTPDVQIANNAALQSDCSPFFTGTLFPTTPPPASLDQYGLRLEDYLSAAFTVGFLLNTTVGASTLDSAYFQANQGIFWNETLSTLPPNTGPWYNLYAKALHMEAINNRCYASPYSDAIGLDSAITPNNLTDASVAPYLLVTLHDSTPFPDPFNDPNSYDVTMTIPNAPGYSLRFRQGGGAWTNVTSGSTYNGLYSNTTTPLEIEYTNPTYGTSQYFVFLKYKVLQPINSYTTSQNAVTNATTFIPNGANPTGFTLNVSGG
ncbi:MAG: hypothetical protein KFB93_07430 [Simkaniaceae bacterium]|nr:MAG: hypothetical protein KFB93_07430 [Simkaniaceae bacterium]